MGLPRRCSSPWPTTSSSRRSPSSTPTEQQVGTDLEGGGDAAKAFEKVSEFAGKMAADGQGNPCDGLANAAQLELFVDHSKKVVEHIEHQAKAHEARVLTAAARKQLQEIDDTAVGGPGGDGQAGAHPIPLTSPSPSAPPLGARGARWPKFTPNSCSSTCSCPGALSLAPWWRPRGAR